MNLKRIGSWCGIVAGIQFVIITFTIMAFYPEGYSFLENSFSSLGLSVTRGIPTPQNWFMFATATTLAGSLSIPFWFTIRDRFTETTPLKALGWLGTILGVIAGPCLAGIGIFAGDVFGVQHYWSTILFFLLFSSAIIIYSIAILINKDYENVYALIGIIVAIICYTHVLVPGFGNAAMQKLAVYSLILYSVFQGYKLLKVYQ
ncbi:MAG: DUF998 domain-containing protein [Candidatus Thorarchaeota archaeon]|jgi:hypothetical membrane protein